MTESNQNNGASLRSSPYGIHSPNMDFRQQNFIQEDREDKDSDDDGFDDRAIESPKGNKRYK